MASTWKRREKLARKIAAQAPVATRFIKEAILTSFDTPLEAALNYEKRLFALLFSTEDQKEGMAAFLEKRKPEWYRPLRGSACVMAEQDEVVILSAVRTPIGKYAGALKEVRPDDLAALVIAEAVRRAGVAPDVVEDVILGCANQAGEDNRNVARMALLLAGLPVEVAGQTVNRLCGSGLQAVNSAAQRDPRGRGRGRSSRAASRA